MRKGSGAECVLLLRGLNRRGAVVYSLPYMKRLVKFLSTPAGSRYALGAVFVLGLGAGVLLSHTTTSGPDFSLTLDSDTPYTFIKPLIGVTTPKSYGEGMLAQLRTSVARTASQVPAGALIRYSYYFRDLTTGAWTGINESDQYDPASLLKIVVAVAAYKQEEKTPGYLARRLSYTQNLADINAAFPFAPKVALSVGESYSVPFLLKKMLSDSDNAAKDLLLSSIDQNVIDKVYLDLSIPKPNDTNSAGYTISPQDYSRFLRVIYYGMYDLSWQNSNELLRLLTDATFTSGLVAGVPDSVHVAHKYGEHIIGSGDIVNGVELSDCGIVYHLRHPYLVCVMTEGKDPLQLANFIARVSHATYAAVDADYR